MLLKEHREIEIDPAKPSFILKRLQQHGSVRAIGSVPNLIWELTPDDNGRQYRLIEGESIDTRLSAPPCIEPLNLVTKNNLRLSEIDPECF